MKYPKLLLTMITVYLPSILSFYSYNNKTIDNKTILQYDPSEDITDIIVAISDFLDENSDINFKDESMAICVTSFASAHYHHFTQFLKYSGKGLSDLGLENDCLEDIKSTYILLIYNLKPKTFEIFDADEVLTFINQTTFFTGLCIPEFCDNVIKTFLNESLNEKFFNVYLQKDQSPISDIFYVNNTEYNSSIYYNGSSYIIYIILGTMISFSIIIQVIACLMTFIFSIEQANNEQESIGLNEASNDESMLIFNTYTKALLASEKKLDCKEFCKKCSVKTSILTNFYYLISRKNNYYDYNDIDLLFFAQTILMIFAMFNQNLSTVIDIPSKDFSNVNFYQSYLFFMVTLSSYSIDCWVALDGMIMIYKLMCFLKKHVYEKHGVITFKDIFKFYLKSIGKILTVVILFFSIHFYANYIIYEISKGNGLFQFYNSQLFNMKELRNSYLFLIPFYAYFDTENLYKKNALKYVLIFINEFYVFTIFLIVFYIGLKIKSKIYDCIVLLIVMINLVLTFLSLSNEFTTGENTFSFRRVVKGNYLKKYPQLLLNNYFIGIIAGMIYFYYNDIISKRPISMNNQTYLPYYFCFRINQILFEMKNYSKVFLLVITLFFGGLLSLSFTLYTKYTGSLRIEISTLVKYFYFYNKITFTFLFICMLLLIKTINFKQSFFSNVINKTVFRIYSRISLTYWCTFDIFVLGCYCLFGFQLKLSYENLWLITLGLFLLGGVVICFLTLAIELPLRILFQDLLFRQKITNDSDLFLIET